MKKDRLSEYRKEIDSIDNRISRLYAARKKVVEKISKYKKENNIKILDKKREAEVIKNVTKDMKSKNDIKDIKHIYKTILSLSKKYQK